MKWSFVRAGLLICWNDCTRCLSCYINLITSGSYLLTFIPAKLMISALWRQARQNCDINNSCVCLTLRKKKNQPKFTAKEWMIHFVWNLQREILKRVECSLKLRHRRCEKLSGFSWHTRFKQSLKSGKMMKRATVWKRHRHTMLKPTPSISHFLRPPYLITW